MSFIHDGQQSSNGTVLFYVTKNVINILDPWPGKIFSFDNLTSKLAMNRLAKKGESTFQHFPG
jgi:hypothetical protein